MSGRLRRVFVVAAIAVLAVLAVAAPAGADVRFPGQRAVGAGAGEVLELRDFAVGFWLDRGVSFGHCADGAVVLDVADDLSDSDVGYRPAGRAWSPLFGHSACRVALDAEVAGALVRHVREPSRSWRRARARVSWVCAVMVHEVGHVAGLLHRESGVMAAEGLEIPGDCRVWARRGVRRPADGR